MGWGGTNLECENLITVESCVCAVVRWTLRRGSDTLKGEQVNEPSHRKCFAWNNNSTSAKGKRFTANEADPPLKQMVLQFKSFYHFLKFVFNSLRVFPSILPRRSVHEQTKTAVSSARC